MAEGSKDVQLTYSIPHGLSSLEARTLTIPGSRDSGLKEQVSAVLCDVCQSMFTNQAPWNDLYAGPLDLHHPYKLFLGNHHRTPQSFLAAIAQPCYICCIIWATIKEDYREKLQALLLETPGENLLTYHARIWDNPELLSFSLEFNKAYLPTLYSGLNVETRFSLWRVEEQRYNTLPLDAGSTAGCGPTNFILKSLERCLKSHAICREHGENSDTALRYPTRLLDLGSLEPERGLVRLIETSNVPPGKPYVTLSHCWGTSNIPRLMEHNLQSYLLEIPPLPKTFEDAIVVAKRLGAQYLWIDSLCIIQDSTTDWDCESQLMDMVYKNAMCNIAAAAAKDSHGGLFFNREAMSDCIVTISAGRGPEKFNVADEDVVSREINGGPLMKRAWVLQEVLLAPRVLYFSRNQVFWECNQLLCCEMHPDGFPDPDPTSRILTLKEAVSRRLQKAVLERDTFGTISQLLGEEDRARLWNRIISAYSGGELTYSSDKLVALSGIAKFLQPLLGNLYFAGIWWDDANIHTYLAWESTCTNKNLAPRPLEYHAPTWSWASTSNPVRFTIGDIYPPSRFLHILSIDTTPISDAMGRVSAGTLIVEGPLNRISIVERPGLKYLDIFQDGEEINSVVSLDAPQELPLNCYTLPVMQKHCEKNEVQSYTGHLIYFLLLQECTGGETSGSYIRCGIASIGYFDCGSLHATSNVKDAPCEDFSSERGQRIRIL